MGTLDLGSIRTELALAISKTSGLKRVHPYIIEKVDEAPCAYVGFTEPLAYNERYGRGQSILTMRVVVICGQLDAEGAQKVYDRLLSLLPLDESELGVTIKDAIEADKTLGGTCRVVHCRRADNLRAVTIGAIDWLAVDLIVEVHT